MIPNLIVGRITALLMVCILFRNDPVVSQEQELSAEADSLHGVILKPGISGIIKPEDMFQQNCADCHTEAIMYYTKYSQFWDTAFKSRDKFIHTWITRLKADSSTKIPLFAQGINIFNDTIPVRNAMVSVMMRTNAEWIPVKSQILLTDDSGRTTLQINDEITGGKSEKVELLVKLIDEIVYPNGKYRLRVNWKQTDENNTGNSTHNRPGKLFVTVIIATLSVATVFYFIYKKFLSKVD